MAFNQVAADSVCALLEGGKSLRAACVEIYALHDPESGDIRYIGKAKDSDSRFKQHLRCKRSTPVYEWVRNLLGRGLSPKLSILMTTWDWERAEVEAIAQYKGEGYSLLNVAIGGNQPCGKPEANAINGAANAKKLHSDPSARHIWWLKKQLGDGLKRGHLSEEVKNKMRIAAMKRPELFGAWSVI